MTDKTIVLITGGNTGLGLESVKALCRSDRQYHILLAGRDINKAKTAASEVGSEISSKSTIEAVQIDVEDDESISKAFEEVSSKYDRIDCLINNAGASFDLDIGNGKMTVRQAWDKAWSVNVTGAHIMTITFLPLLVKSSDPRLIFITSGLSSLELCADTSSKRYIVPPAGLPKTIGPVGYMSTKAGLNMMMIHWTRMLKNDGVKVWSLAPGLLATGLGGNKEYLKKMGAKDPEVGGTAVLNVVEGKRDAEVGKVIREYDTPIQPW